MIVSFHPIIEADKNVICAGRLPDNNDLEVIRNAQAVILPQGCSEPLYHMARANCPHVFPNTDIRFDFPGKLGQIRLFHQLGVHYPETALYSDLAEFNRSPACFELPWVVKLNWGGQGDGIWVVNNTRDLDQTRNKLALMENTGQFGFLIQKHIDTQRRSLRIAIIGDRIESYWRIQSATQPFGTGVAHGAQIDFNADPHLQEKAIAITRWICQQTQLQLGGLDFIFSCDAVAQGIAEPFLLEINYFFGRAGLGGSQGFYQLFTTAVDRWLAGIGLTRGPSGPV